MSKHDIQYLKIAQIWAENSYAKRLKVGAIIVKDNTIIADGYNGSISGFPNECEYIEYSRVSHPFIKGLEVDTDGNIFKNGKLAKQVLHYGGKYTYFKAFGKAFNYGRTIIEAFVENPDPEFYTQVNHINYDVEDNRLINLEWCSNRYNSIHRDARAYKTSQYPGVSKCKDRNKWVASALIDGKQIKKRFDTPEEAFEFYKLLLDKRHFTGIAYPNIKTINTVLHAEANAIAKIAKSNSSSAGSTIYTLVSPCLECSKLIIQAGIKRVVYADEYRLPEGIDLLKKAGIEVEKLTIKNK